MYTHTHTHTYKRKEERETKATEKSFLLTLKNAHEVREERSYKYIFRSVCVVRTRMFVMLLDAKNT